MNGIFLEVSWVEDFFTIQLVIIRDNYQITIYSQFQSKSFFLIYTKVKRDIQKF